MPPAIPDAVPTSPDDAGQPAPLRDAFLLDPDTVFLNHGSFGACPAEVFAVYQQWQRELERNPVEFLGRRSAALLWQARQQLAAYVGAAAQDLVFVANATTGVNVVARSLGLQPGDQVLATDHEYGACDATWRFVCAQAGAQYVQVALPLPFRADEVVPRLMAAVTPRTRLVFASHITSTTALTLPVAVLCVAARERGIDSFIDGAHAPGQVALDLSTLGADFYTGNAHKWLCAPKGAAFLHARPERQRMLDATVVSWGYEAERAGAGAGAGASLDVAAPSAFDSYTGVAPFERRLQWQGTRDIAAFLAVPAAIDFQQRHHWPAWRARCHRMAMGTLHRVLARNGLQPIAPDAAYGQMVTVPVRATDPEALRSWLFERHRIEVPVTRHGDACFVRVSVQAYNSPADLAALEAALAEAGV
jgi:isopenicillin-N epimerase